MNLKSKEEGEYPLRGKEIIRRKNYNKMMKKIIKKKIKEMKEMRMMKRKRKRKMMKKMKTMMIFKVKIIVADKKTKRVNLAEMIKDKEEIAQTRINKIIYHNKAMVIKCYLL